MSFKAVHEAVVVVCLAGLMAISSLIGGAASARAEAGYVDLIGGGRVSGEIMAVYPGERVLVRLSDLKSNEYRELLGGRLFEPQEENPMIAWRGAARYVDPRFSAAFEMELDALQMVRQRIGLDNLQLMVPFCRTPEEGARVVDVLDQHGLSQGRRVPGHPTEVVQRAQQRDGGDDERRGPDGTEPDAPAFGVGYAGFTGQRQHPTRGDEQRKQARQVDRIDQRDIWQRVGRAVGTQVEPENHETLQDQQHCTDMSPVQPGVHADRPARALCECEHGQQCQAGDE